MTLQEILKSQGLSVEQVETIIGEMKQSKIYTTSHENMDVRYPKLKEQHESLTAQHGEANNLIEQFKKDAKGNEELQGKITAYETQIGELQEKLKQTQLEAEGRVALLAEGAIDIDYLMYKLKEKGDLELGEDGKIKGIDDKLAGLKTAHPAQFKNEAKGVKVDALYLPESDTRKEEPKTLAEALEMKYEQNNNQ